MTTPKERATAALADRTGISNPPILFIYSDADRDGLSAAAALCGYAVIAARRTEDMAERLLGSGAGVAIIDLRTFEHTPQNLVAMITEVVAENGLSLIAIANRHDESVMRGLIDSAATHLLSAPFSDLEFQAVVSMALGASERSRAHYGHRPRRWTLGDGSDGADFDSELRLWIGEAQCTRYPRSALYRRLRAPERRAARACWKRLGHSGSAAFSHQVNGRHAFHHVKRSAIGVSGLIEFPDDLVQWPARDPVTGFPTISAGLALLDHRLQNPASSPQALLLVRAALVDDPLVRLATARRLAALAGRELGSSTTWITVGDGAVALVPSSQWTVRQIERFAEAVLDSLSKPVATDNGVHHLLARAVVIPTGGADAASTLFLAQQRLTAELPPEIDRQSSGSAIVAAIENAEIAVMLQPQFAVGDGRIVGAEALARWNDPVEGMVGAATLFAVANSEDHVAMLSEHVQTLAIASLRTWPPALQSLHLSINVTAEDLATATFAARIAALAGDFASRVVLEITETALITDLEGVAAQLAELRAAGFRIAIDDFGTGYSSLSYLKALPLDLLKLDQGLTNDLASGGRGNIVARSVITMARELSLDVVLEGIETHEQLAFAADEGASYWQGFLRSGPLAPTQFIDFALRAD